MITKELKDKIQNDEFVALGITSTHTDFYNGVIIYYQGDEPPKAIIEETEEQSKIDISGVDIDTLTDEQLLKLKTRLGL